MDMLDRRQKEELDVIKEQAKADKEAWNQQMQMMKEADMKTQSQLQKQLEAADERAKQANKAILVVKQELEKSRKEAKDDRVAADQKMEAFQTQFDKAAEGFHHQLTLLAEREKQSNKVINDMMRMREEDRKEYAFFRNHITTLNKQLEDANKPGFIRRMWRKIF